MFRQQCVINERTNIIPIKTNMVETMKEDFSPKGQYSLKANFFDPSKSSPPNEFMIKLRSRVNRFDSFASYYETMKEANFDKE